MKIQIFETSPDVAEALADRIAGAIRRQPAIVLGLPTGRTPIRTYERLRRMHVERAFDATQLTTFNLDEFVGIDRSHPGSFRAFMHAQLFDSLRLRDDQIHFLDGMAADAEAECARYEEAIDRAEGIDLQIVGIGANGHIGFNEPGETLQARTHRVRLADSTRRDNAGLFGNDPGQVPREALSMGMGTILKARSLVLIATGERKAQCIEQAVRGAVTTRLPASFLQVHPNVELYLDRAAGSRLRAG